VPQPFYIYSRGYWGNQLKGRVPSPLSLSLSLTHSLSHSLSLSCAISFFPLPLVFFSCDLFTSFGQYFQPDSPIIHSYIQSYKDEQRTRSTEQLLNHNHPQTRFSLLFSLSLLSLSLSLIQVNTTLIPFLLYHPSHQRNFNCLSFSLPILLSPSSYPPCKQPSPIVPSPTPASIARVVVDLRLSRLLLVVC
jgi:hypothetical protein